MKLLRYLTIAGDSLYVAWILYNGMDEGWRGATEPEVASSIGLTILLILNSILILEKNKKPASLRRTFYLRENQWGMMHEEKGVLPPGAWWLAPLGVLDHTILATDPNGDRDGAEILGLLALLLILFPFIPYLNRLPEKIGLAKKIWGRPQP